MRIDIMSPLIGKICPYNTLENTHANLHTFPKYVCELERSDSDIENVSFETDRQTYLSSLRGLLLHMW